MTWRNAVWAGNVPSELAVSLDNFEIDDKKPPTLSMAVEEAQYVIDLHYEAGTVSWEMLNGRYGDGVNQEEKKEAQQTIKDCKSFIRKFKKQASREGV